MRRTPQGVRGLKQGKSILQKYDNGRTPQGVRGLKPGMPDISALVNVSHSARSAWIETLLANPYENP